MAALAKSFALLKRSWFASWVAVFGGYLPGGLHITVLPFRWRKTICFAKVPVAPFVMTLCFDTAMVLRYYKDSI